VLALYLRRTVIRTAVTWIRYILCRITVPRLGEPRTLEPYCSAVYILASAEQFLDLHGAYMSAGEVTLIPH
jgi:hypothetical protein